MDKLDITHFIRVGFLWIFRSKNIQGGTLVIARFVIARFVIARIVIARFVIARFVIASCCCYYFFVNPV